MLRITVTEIMFIVASIAILLQVISLRGDVRFMKPAYVGMLLSSTALGVLLTLTASSTSKTIVASWLAGYLIQPAYAVKRSFSSPWQANRYRLLNEFAHRVRWLHLLAGIPVLLLVTANLMTLAGYEKNWTYVVCFSGVFSLWALLVSRWRWRRWLSSSIN